MAPSQFGMFTKSGPDRQTADLEYHVQPLSTDRLGDPLHPFPAITVSVCNLRPTSVGSVHATMARPEVQPDIRLNYLTTAEDHRIAVASIRQVRQIMTARALRPYQPAEWLPGPSITTDAELAAKAGDIATTIFHPVGTCRMGSDPASVVDPQLKLRGIGGLRVVDASIMPRIVSGNTASPVIMIAERAADLILDRI
jgi:choline dehydrogenase